MFKCCFKTEVMLLWSWRYCAANVLNVSQWRELILFGFFSSNILGDFIHLAFPLFHFCGQVSFCSKKKRKSSHGHPRLSSVVATTRVPDTKAISNSSGNFPQFFPSQRGWRPGRPHRRSWECSKRINLKISHRRSNSAEALSCTKWA